MEHTQSATKLNPVVVEPNGFGGADVWLNRNIVETAIEQDGNTQIMWEADQLHYVDETVPAVSYIEENFDTTWAEHSPSEDIPMADLATALAELSVTVSDSVDMQQLNADAIAELSELVSNLMGGE